jgi:ornithine carbamoyltransferase
MDRKKHFLTLADYTGDEILSLLRRSGQIKKGIPGIGPARPLEGRFVAIMFEKSSTRTRVSFEVGVRQLGGQVVFLGWNDIQISRGEPICDTARVLSRYLDALVVRTFGQEIVEELARWSSIPIINGLTDQHHPCQVVADLFTLYEKGVDVTAMTFAWIGDGNNMANSWIAAAKQLGFKLKLACPQGYDPAEVLDPKNMLLTRDPEEAVKDAHVVSTDVWASMGQEAEADVRRGAFQGFQLNMGLLNKAREGAYVLHCLPAHRGEEITEDVLESPNSLIWDEAENRLHVQKAILELLIR